MRIWAVESFGELSPNETPNPLRRGKVIGVALSRAHAERLIRSTPAPHLTLWRKTGKSRDGFWRAYCGDVLNKSQVLRIMPGTLLLNGWSFS